MSSPSGEEPPFRLVSLTRTVYAPSLLFSTGEGAVSPIIALLALELGASPAMAGAIVGLRAVGTMLFNIPAGTLIDRYGEHRVMTVGAVLLGLVTASVALRPPLVGYALLIMVVGAASAAWMVARLSLVTETAPVHHRGRAMSLLGGTNRAGAFLGASLGALTLGVVGLVGAFAIQAAFAGMAALLLATHRSTSRRSTAPTAAVSLRSVASDHRGPLARAGSVAVAVAVVRSSRTAVIPLWGTQVGLEPAQVAAIFAISSALEMVLFYPGGLLMDRRGRKWVGVPFLVLMSVGMALVPTTESFRSLLVVSLVMSLANGLGSGINMTLGSDLSPKLGRSQFLGIWRLITDAGVASGPLMVAAVTATVSLGAAAVASGGIGLLGVVLLGWAVPETLRSSDRTAP